MTVDDERAQVGRFLDKAFTEVADLHDEVTRAGWGEPLPGSPLSADDRRSGPYHVSHQVTHGLNGALEGLHAVRALVVGAQVLYPAAPFVLMRSALEAAGVATWVLQPQRRDERVTRTLWLARKNLHDQRTAVTRLGLDETERHDRALAQVEATATAAGLTLPKQITTTAMLEEVSAAESAFENIPRSQELLSVWQISSGFTHARSWALLGILDRETVEADDQADTVRLRLTGDVDRVAWLMLVGCRVFARLLELYRQRCSALQ